MPKHRSKFKEITDQGDWTKLTVQEYMWKRIPKYQSKWEDIDTIQQRINLKNTTKSNSRKFSSFQNITKNNSNREKIDRKSFSRKTNGETVWKMTKEITRLVKGTKYKHRKKDITILPNNSQTNNNSQKPPKKVHVPSSAQKLLHSEEKSQEKIQM